MHRITGKMPRSIRIFIFLSYILPFAVGSLFIQQGISELRWILFIIPTFFFAYYFGLKGGVISSLLTNAVIGLCEWRWVIITGGYHDEWPVYITSIIVMINFSVAVGMGIQTDRLSKKQARLNLYNPLSEQEDKEHFWIEKQLYKAIKSGDFTLYYQPRVALKDERIVGTEALIRWHHPEKGMISPHTFIPIAEQTALIIPLGEWVLREACRQTKKWSEQGHTLFVSVNVSACQLQRELVETIRNILKETELDPSLLELEMTESLLMRDEEESINLFIELKKLGIRLSIDDFGTGYSSLSYLKKLPFDCIKIDQFFIKDIERDTSIVNAIIYLADKFHLSLVAEGVESQEQVAILKNIHCESAQGYFFSPPVKPEEFEQLFLLKV